MTRKEISRTIMKRATDIIGLPASGPAPCYFPLRMEYAWRAELKANGTAPAVPFDLPDVLPLGPIAPEVLRRSIEISFARHTALRTSVAVENGQLVQHIHDKASPPIVEVTLDSADRSSDYNMALKYIESAAAIDLNREPGVRFYIFKTPREHVLLGIATHHYVSDNWSLRMLFREISAGCASLSTGTPSLAREPQQQYADYTLAQRKSLQSDLYNHLKFWKDATGTAPGAAPPRDLAGDTRWMTPLYFSFPAGFYVLIRRLSKELQTTNFIIALALYQIALARWTGSKDVLNAVAIADRDRAAFQSTFGYLVTAMPIRSDLDGSINFSKFVETLTRKIRQAYKYKALCYEAFQEIFSIPSPFCTTLFGYVSSSHIHQIDETPVSEDLTPKFRVKTPFLKQFHHRDLFFQIRERSDAPGMLGSIFFCGGSFEQETLQKFVCDFAALFEAACRDPHQTLDQLLELDGARRPTHVPRLPDDKAHAARVRNSKRPQKIRQDCHS